MRNRCERLRGARVQRPYQLKRRLVVDSRVEKQERPGNGQRAVAGRRVGSDSVERRSVNQRRLRQLFLVPIGQFPDIDPACTMVVEPRQIDVGVTQVPERAGQRAPHASEARDGCKIVEPVSGEGFECRACAHRLRAQRRRDRKTAACKLSGREAGGELPQAQPMQPE